MKTKLLSALILLAFLLTACSKDELDMPDSTAKSEGIHFEMGFAPQTRVATDVNFKSTWELGDEVGLFAVKRVSGEPKTLQAAGNYMHNVKLTYDATEWSGDAYYPSDGDVLDFYAYYPYIDDAGLDPTNMTFTVLADQSTAINYSKSDLLSAKATGIAKGTTVNLTFAHELALVQIKVEQGKDTPDFEDTFAITLKNVKSKASFDWTSGAIATGTISDIKMLRIGGSSTTQTFRALVPAQNIASGTTLFAYTQTITGKEINLNYTTTEKIDLVASKANLLYDWVEDSNIDPNHEYAVGDFYPYKGKPIGVVYEVSGDKKHGKIVSLDEGYNLQWSTESVTTGARNPDDGMQNMQTIKEFISNNDKDWSNYPAFEWVHEKNGGDTDYSNSNAMGIWYLPALNELTALYSTYNSYGKDGFNSVLTTAGGTVLSSNYYWSSSEYNFNFARAVYFANGTTANDTKNFLNLVRCVSAF